MYQTILAEIDQSVGILTLNRPERHNAFDDQLIDELTDGLLALEDDPEVRVVVLSSTGRSFCAGADLSWLKRAMRNNEQQNLSDARRLARLMRTLNELTKPTIARVQGLTFGAGIGLVAACDIALATYDAQFALSDVKLGVLPAIVSPYLLAAIGERQCRRYLLTAERFSAAEAYRIGLVHEIVPGEEELDDAIGEIVDSLVKNGPNAQAECKALLRVIGGLPIDDATVEETTQRAALVRSTPEGQEGLAAFLEKRKPNWIA